MIDTVPRILHRLGEQLPGRVSMPGDAGYIAATAIWAKPIDRVPRAIVHCRAPGDVHLAIRAARESGVPLSVRGGGHDWAGRALCGGIVIDLRAMNSVVVDSDHRVARTSGGARASDVVAVTDPLGVAPVAGSVGAVGFTGLTLGGRYGALIGRFGLALDNVVAAEIVLADGRVVVASRHNEEELFWAVRGGGGNFGVVTPLHHQLTICRPFAREWCSTGSRKRRPSWNAAPHLPHRRPTNSPCSSVRLLVRTAPRWS